MSENEEISTSLRISPELAGLIGPLKIYEPDRFGKGHLGDPLFPIEVTLSGTDGNAYALIARVLHYVRAELRKIPRTFCTSKDIKAIEGLLFEDLTSSTSYGELLRKLQMIVFVT